MSDALLGHRNLAANAVSTALLLAAGLTLSGYGLRTKLVSHDAAAAGAESTG